MGEPLCDATVAEIAAATDGDDAQLILHATMRDGSWCRPGDEVVVFRADSLPAPSEARAELISVAASLARLSFFDGDDGDHISNQSHENITRLAARIKDVADGLRAASQPCPRVETGDEGTSFCRLAEAGDRPVPPTRQQIVDAIDSALNDPRLFPGAWSRTPAHYVDAAADALLELLSGGVPTEPEETTDWETDEVNRRSKPMGLLDGADGDMAEIAGHLAAKYPEAAWGALLAAGAIEQVGWRSAVDGSLWDMRMGGEPFTGDNYQGDTPVYRLTQKTEETQT